MTFWRRGCRGHLVRGRWTAVDEAVAVSSSRSEFDARSFATSLNHVAQSRARTSIVGTDRALVRPALLGRRGWACRVCVRPSCAGRFACWKGSSLCVMQRSATVVPRLASRSCVGCVPPRVECPRRRGWDGAFMPASLRSAQRGSFVRRGRVCPVASTWPVRCWGGQRGCGRARTRERLTQDRALRSRARSGERAWGCASLSHVRPGCLVCRASARSPHDTLVTNAW